MRADLKERIRKALVGSSSQQLVDIAKLYPLAPRKQVEAALLEMYRTQEVGCCLITKDSVQKSVWWLTAKVMA